MARRSRTARLRRRVFELLDQGSSDPAALVVEWALIALIVGNVLAAILESVPTIEASAATLFLAIEGVSVAAFTLEYALRLWSAPERARARSAGWRARLAFAVQPQSIVDLLAIAPVYVAFVTTADLRSLVVLRLFRFFKLARYSPGLSTLFNAVYGERRALLACAVILMGVVLVAASLMHFAEMDTQPDKLGTIPDAMYWAFVTLSTVGYGDVVPLTPLGKLVASGTAVVGIVMLALPVGILASAFADEIRRRDFVVTWTMVAKVPLFAELDAAELAGIMRFLNARSCEPGHAIVRRGEPARAMFFITSGTVEVELPGGPVRLGAGDFFGEMGLLSRRERNATVNAVSRTRLLVLEAEDLHYLMEQTPAMGRRIREIAERRARSGPQSDAAADPGGR